MMVDSAGSYVNDERFGEPHVLVLLAAHQGARFLESQVATIQCQTGVRISILICVDLSTDQTEEIAKRIALEDSRVSILANHDRLGSAAANFFKLVRDADFGDADFVAFADQDDLWFPQKLMSAIALMSETGSSGYSGNVLAWYQNSTVRLISKDGPQRRWDHLFSAPGPGCSQVMSRSLADALQSLVSDNFDAMSRVDYHDWLLYAFARQRGFRWIIDSEPYMLYRQHESNQLGANVGLKAAASRFGALRDGWFWDQARLIAQLVGASDATPMRILARGGWRARLGLAFLSPHLRREKFESLAFALAALATPLPPARTVGPSDGRAR